jgi:hypothetical protein
MTWLLYVVYFLIAAVAISAPLVLYYFLGINFSETAGPNSLPKPSKNEVLTCKSDEGRRIERLPIKEGNKRNAQTGCNLRRRQQKSRESDEYWASDESGGRSSGRKSPVKKPKGKRGPQTRFGVTESSESSMSDNQKPPSSSPQESEQRLAFLNSGTERDSGESALRGKPANYSGNGSPRSTDSESLVPVKDHTPHVSMHVVAIDTIILHVCVHSF